MPSPMYASLHDPCGVTYHYICISSDGRGEVSVKVKVQAIVMIFIPGYGAGGEVVSRNHGQGGQTLQDLVT